MTFYGWVSSICVPVQGESTGDLTFEVSLDQETRPLVAQTSCRAQNHSGVSGSGYQGSSTPLSNRQCHQPHDVRGNIHQPASHHIFRRSSPLYIIIV